MESTVAWMTRSRAPGAGTARRLPAARGRPACSSVAAPLRATWLPVRPGSGRFPARTGDPTQPRRRLPGDVDGRGVALGPTLLIVVTMADVENDVCRPSPTGKYPCGALHARGRVESQRSPACRLVVRRGRA